MNILFEEHAAEQRAGGIEAATQGLIASLAKTGVVVTRNFTDAAAATGMVPDCVHIHGIWSPVLARRFRYWRRKGIPCVVTVHGMLEPWALAHKKLKKQVAWHLYQKRLLNQASALHATSEREAENLKNLGLKVPVAMIPWGIKMPRIESESRKVERRVGRDSLAAPTSSSIQNSKSEIQNSPTRTALFVGRIYPVKGLPMLVEAWAKLRPAGWNMRIVGPDEAGHLQELQRLCEQFGLQWNEGRAGFTNPADLSPSTRGEQGTAYGGPALRDGVGRMRKSDPTIVNRSLPVEFSGPLEGEAIARAYREADLFILPSHTENFGMVVGEAMAHGLPVITTHGAPWKLLEEEKCGWWVPVSVDGITAALEDATRSSPEELAAMGARGRAVVAERFSWDKIAREMTACYEWVLGRGPRPCSVVL